MRVASKPSAGGGHLSRCLVLAHAIGCPDAVTFCIDTDTPAATRERIAAARFSYIEEPADRSLQAEVVVIDTYMRPEGLLAEWKTRGKMLVVLEDGPFPPEHADVVVSTAPRSWSPGGFRLMAGLRYALVDPAYAKAGQSRRIDHPDVAAHVLITFGQRDSAGATQIVLSTLADAATRGWKPCINIVMATEAPHLAAVRSLLSRFQGRARLSISPDGLVDHFSHAAMAIGAGGVSAIEACAMGCPSLLLETSPSQRPIIDALASKGAAIDTGNLGSFDKTEFLISVLSLAQDRERRTAISARARSIIDGKGASRLVQSINDCLTDLQRP
jgi:UDP-2,4-diacetamido-2,4,6-trideoxy-beta-L-altropyranose hydrolase